jgi:peptidoglycan/xylan/chitin deacetylase (PgdA/CDA1 family)
MGQRLLLVALVLLAGCSAAHPAGQTTASAAPSATSPLSPLTGVADPSGPLRFAIPVFPPAPVPVPVSLPPGEAAPFLLRVPTTQPVAFLTIDDGYVKTAAGPQLIAAAHIPVTLFLTTDAIRDNPEYFRPMQKYGAVIEAHTITHANLRGRSYAFQRHEICGSADKLASWYGRRPVFFRPPFGNKDSSTLRAAHDCGLRAVFMWSETVDQGRVRYQQGHAIQAGDIILMHFRPAFAADFLAALNAIHRAGLTPALLEDYVEG